jgi:hypothetical protein
MVASAAASAISQQQAAKKAGGQTGGIAVTEMPKYSWTEPTQRLTADYVSQNIQRMNEGKNPAWYDKLAPQIQTGLQNQNYQNYFGTPGQRTGIVNQAVSGGAGAGLGAGATNRRKWTALQDYGNKSSLIDQYMATQNMNMMQQQSTEWPKIAAGLPAGPNSQASSYGYSTPAAANPWGQLGNTVAGLPWENMLSSSGSKTPNTGNYGTMPNGSWGYGGNTPYSSGGFSIQGQAPSVQYTGAYPAGGIGW